VLLHGAGAGVSARANWWLNIPALASSFRVIAPDLVGFGASLPDDPAKYPFSLENWLEHVITLLDRLEIAQADFIGNSLGGWVSLWLAIKHPDRVRRMITMGTGGVPETHLPLLTQHLHLDRTREAMRQNLVDFTVDPSIVTEELIDLRFAESSSEVALAARTATSDARMRDRLVFSLSDEALRQVKCPVLAIHGREDPMISYQASVAVATQVPDAEMHLYAHCGHWAQIERPEDFNKQALAFLG
jgi:pimeloyl-ACP methyl ester carboxylesterase